MGRAEIKKRLHCARMNLDYQTKRAKGATPEKIAETRAEVERLTELYADLDPARCTMRVRSPYFIGPKRKRGQRGDGPTIKCFRCQVVKPVEEFYEKGTVCKCCFVKRSVEWAKRNPERSAAVKRESVKERKRNDPGYRVMMNCRCRLGDILKSINAKRGSHFSELIGTTSRGLTLHFESLFLPGMTWDNYGWGPGKWVADHIIPARNFDHLIEDEVMKAWHFTNLQPLWWKENQEKSDFLPCGRRARHVKILLTT